MALFALESAIAPGKPSPPVGPVPKQDRFGRSRDEFSQLLRTTRWEADANQLRRAADVLARDAAEEAPQASACSAWDWIVQSELGMANQASINPAVISSSLRSN